MKAPVYNPNLKNLFHFRHKIIRPIYTEKWHRSSKQRLFITLCVLERHIRARAHLTYTGGESDLGIGQGGALAGALSKNNFLIAFGIREIFFLSTHRNNTLTMKPVLCILYHNRLVESVHKLK